MAAWAWILIVIAAVVILAPMAMAGRQRRAMAPRQCFGPDYDGGVPTREGWRVAGAGLRDRERKPAHFDIRPLPGYMRARFAEQWRDAQERFVDQPLDARLRSMSARAPADQRTLSAEGNEMTHERL